MRNLPRILKTMFAVFFILQIIFYTRLYANNVDATKLDSYINNLDRTNQAMLSVSITEGGNAVYSRSIGFMDPTFTIQSDINTKYRIGELSKTFTTVILMQMVEEKMIQLGTPISRFFPEIPNGRNISIRDLLSERVNIVNYLPGGEYYRLIKSEYVFDQLLKELSRNATTNPYAFNNPNYQMLALIVEKLSGKSYNQLVGERIINRLGLENTFSGSQQSNFEASAFTHINDEWQVNGTWDLESVKGAASMVSTPSDLSKFMDALFHETLVNSKSLKSMMCMSNGKGIGLNEIKLGSKIGYGYQGEIDGVFSQMIYFPVDGICISFSINADDHFSDNLMTDLVKIIYGS